MPGYHKISQGPVFLSVPGTPDMVAGNRCQLGNQQVPDLFQQECFFVRNPKAILVLFPFRSNLDLVAIDGLLPEPSGTAKLDIPGVP